MKTTTLQLIFVSALSASLVAGQSIDPQPEDFVDFVGIIQDPTQPLPSCETVGVQEILGCQALCVALGDTVDIENARDVNQEFICPCETQPACSDRPTCSQLVILPGEVESSCTSICGDQFMAFEDFIEYAGGETNANKNLTHFVLECRCAGDVQCSDYLLFSDLSFPKKCETLEITSDETCGAYCSSESGGLFDTSSTFNTTDGVASCFCSGSDSLDEGALKEVEACTDAIQAVAPEACTLKDPCPTPAPTEVGEEPTGSPPSGSTASSRNIAAALVLATVAIAVGAWI